MSEESNNLQADRKKITSIFRRNPLVFILWGLDYVWVWLIVQLFGWLAYDRKYLKTRHFKYLWSPGWRWAYNGMFKKLFCGHGRGIPWPIGSTTGINALNIDFDPEDLNNFQTNTYFQCWSTGRIIIGCGTYIAQGCALITTNHDPRDPDKHLPAQDIVLGEKCWLGANVVVMPGVVLGNGTVVGANAVVTKSFPEGNCIIAGVPATIIKELD